jgi:hypothetical protein
MIFKHFQPIQIIFFIALSLMLPLWNIPGTIAIRYFCALSILFVVIVSKVNWKCFFYNNQAIPLLFLYLLIQLFFFSTDFDQALHNFKSEWLKFILFSIAGIGSGYFVQNIRTPKLILYLGFLFAIPLIIHLFLCIIYGISIGKVPMGYWGINKTHGDLAYTSLQAVIFIAVYWFFQSKTPLDKILSFILLSTCLISPLIASSRGGTFFVFISILTVLGISSLTHQKSQWSMKHLIVSILGLSIMILGVCKIAQSLDPHRWEGTLSRLEMGFKGDALKINCDGIEVLQNSLKIEGTELTPQTLRILESIKDGDGARVMAARSALHLITENPMGINQSRLGYEIALEKYCGYKPKIMLLNSHNGWLDTALAIGVIGAILYLLVYLNFLRFGLKTSFGPHKELVPYGVALFSLGFMWMVRSIFDSAQRDQMLEMQAFTLCLLSSYILFFKKTATSD